MAVLLVFELMSIGAFEDRNCMDFNIIESDGALEFLSSVAELDASEARRFYFGDGCNSGDLTKRIDQCFGDVFSSVDISDCRVFGMHLTASVDQCDSIRKNGLLNLRKVLQGDNPLGNSIRESGVRFDGDYQFMYFNNQQYGLRDELEKRPGSPLARIARKLLVDYGINAFLYNPLLGEYGNDVASSPEFLQDLRNCLQDKGFSCEWGRSSASSSRRSRAYRVEFWVNVADVCPTTFGYESNRTILGNRNSRKVLCSMTELALNRAFGLSDAFLLYLKPTACVPGGRLCISDIS